MPGFIHKIVNLLYKFSDKVKSTGNRIFNIFSKNFIAELNDKVHTEKKRIFFQIFRALNILLKWPENGKEIPIVIILVSKIIIRNKF